MEGKGFILLLLMITDFSFACQFCGFDLKPVGSNLDHGVQIACHVTMKMVGVKGP